MRQHGVYIGISSNYGDRVAALREAVSQMRTVIQVQHVSQLYALAPLGRVQSTSLVSAVVQATTSLTPNKLLEVLQHIERNLGRRAGAEFAPHPIDLDILLMDSLQVDSMVLTIPHPHLAERAYVLKPLAELAPNLLHPVRFYTIRQLLDDVEDADHVCIFVP